MTCFMQCAACKLIHEPTYAPTDTNVFTHSRMYSTRTHASERELREVFILFECRVPSQFKMYISAIAVLLFNINSDEVT